MKTLDPAKNQSGHFLFKPVKLLAVAGIIASVAIFFLAAWLYRFPENQIQDQSLQKAREIVSLADELAVQPALQIRNSLALMARNPEMRQIVNTSYVKARYHKNQKDLSLLLNSYEPLLGHVYGQILDFSSDIDYYLELPSALLRRLAMIAGIAFSQDVQGDPAAILRPAKLSYLDIERMSVQTGVVSEKMAALRRIVADSCRIYLHLALTIENLAGFNRQSLQDVAAVEDFFSAALNDEMLRALMLRSLDGEVMALVGDMPEDGMNFDTRDCRAIGAGSIFFSGPVGFDSRRKHTLWWVAVPVRDENRNPVAILAAFVNIDFLCRAAEKVAEKTDSRLVYTDFNGVVIGYADREVVARQINMSKILPSFSNEAERGFSSRFVRNDGRLLLQAGKSVKRGNVRHLPDWYVCYEQDLTGVVRQSQFLVTVSVILLAAMGMYALSCCVVRLF